MQTIRTVKRVLETVSASGVIAIVRLDDLSQARPLAEALLAGGVTALEFTLTNPQALAVIAQLKVALPHFAQARATIGAGTVLDVASVEAVVEAGAEFVVSPFTSLPVIRRCQELGVAVMPGALTPTEIMAASQAGASAIKVFPARSYGPAYIKDLCEPLPFLKLIPTGGINLTNVAAYIKSGVLAVGVGSNIVVPDLIAQGDWVKIETGARALVEAVRQARQP